MLQLQYMIAIGLGAFLGAIIRWFIGVQFNLVFVYFPVGTLLVNLAGSFMIGIAVAYFSHSPHFSESLRLFIITGFLGGLTTFSTFSLELIQLLQLKQFFYVAMVLCSHVLGSVILTFLGIYLYYMMEGI